MKALNATSAKANAAGQPTGRSSARQPTRTSADSFALSGPSTTPDPQFHAYRRDLADVSLAGQVITSHYAKAVDRVVSAPAALRPAPSEDAEPIRDLAAGEPFAMLDNSLGWAWGYAGRERRVGYVRAEAVEKA